MGSALQLVEALSLERGALQQHALGQDSGTDDLVRIATANDALLDRAQARLLRAALPDQAVSAARDMLRLVRARVAETSGHPVSERDPELVTTFIRTLDAPLSAVAAATALAERDAARANATIGTLVAVGSRAVDMRASAGWRSSTLAAWMGGSTLTTAQLDQEMLMTGNLQLAWEQLQRQVRIAGEPPRLAASVAQVQDGFFREAEPRYLALIAAARSGAERPMSMAAFRRWSVPQLTGILVIRDAAIDEAVAYGRTLVAAAQTRLLVVGAVTIGLLAFVGLAFLVMLHRVVLPVQRLTEAVTRLAAGDTNAAIPGLARRDEVGAMAAAIEVCRDNAVRLAQTNLRFDAALSNMAQGIAMYDAEERLVVMNARLMNELPPGALRIGMTFREVIATRASFGQFPGRTVQEVYEERRAARDAGASGAFEDLQGDVRFVVFSRQTADGGWLTTYLDETERKQAEAALVEANEMLEQRVADALEKHRDIEAALHQSQKMEAVGQLTGGLAHDFNNMLASISGSLEVLQSRIGAGRVENLERYIVMAQSAAKRAAALTHRLLAFSRRQTLDPRTTDVNRLVSEMEDLLCRTIGPEIRLEVVGADDLWNTLIDPNQLENALLNLCINARDAMPGGGQITIETVNSRFEAAAINDDDLPPGEYVSIRVSDTGSGMSPETISRAFDPFFTTKPIGSGTGLGLSMIYGFVRQSGGRVRITSRIGAGTQITMHLPRHDGAAEMSAMPAEAAATVQATSGETVLVVDDEPTLRMLVAEVLEERGYAAIACPDGSAGLKVLESGRRIDLLITDVGLPGGMNGRQLADAARRTRADLKVLFITGYAETSANGSGQLAPGMQVMTKPFPMEMLAKRVTSIIASR